MYNKPDFVLDAKQSFELIADHPLAQLVVATPTGLKATPAPLVRRGDSLVGHVARPNDIWQHPGDALAIFTGIDAYISPNWYPSKAQHGRVVPTWNYTTVHVRATLRIHDADTFEASQPRPWKVTDAPTDYTAALMQRIVGIELTNLAVEGKGKLSQNQGQSDLEGVRAALAGGDARQQGVAQKMRRRSS